MIGREEEAKQEILSALESMDVKVKGEDATLEELTKIYKNAISRRK